MGKRDLFEKSQMEMSFRGRKNWQHQQAESDCKKRFKPEREAEQRRTAKREKEEIERNGLNIFF